MVIHFFIRSRTIDISNYNIKDIPGSSGRLDVISRCILAAILNNNKFDNDFRIWVFLEEYGSYLFNPCHLDYPSFPKNEIMLSDYLVDLLRNKSTNFTKNNNPLRNIKMIQNNIFKVIKHFKRKNYAIFILSEGGTNFLNQWKNFTTQKNIIFIIGSQTGEILRSKEIIELNLPMLSLGSKSYLASSVIRLIKISLNLSL